MTALTYTDHEGNRQTVNATLTVDAHGRHWIWSEQLQHNLARARTFFQLWSQQ